MTGTCPTAPNRCLQCFSYRLKVAALQAKELGLAYFTTTLASSRWKSLEQMNFPQKVKFSVFSFGGLVELSYLCT